MAPGCNSHFQFDDGRGGRGWKCKNHHLLTPHWSGRVFTAPWVPQRNAVGVALYTPAAAATAGRVLGDLLGLMHNALCVFWWRMDEWQGGPSPLQNLKRVFTLYLLSLPPLSFSLSLSLSLSHCSVFSFMLFAGNIQQHWCGLFPVCVWHQNKGTVLLQHAIAISLFVLSLSTLPFISHFYDIFCKNDLF